MLSGGTYYTGGGGVEAALREFGIEPLFGIEYDADIAGVARANGIPARVADARAVDPETLPSVDWLHASPPCVRASSGSGGAWETEEDTVLARAVMDYLVRHKPRWFSLENVTAYAEFQAFANLLALLHREGYAFRWWSVDAADFGVPQNRRRLLLLARLGGLQPKAPLQTHTDQLTPILEKRQPHVGWYETVRDLLPEMPRAEFANWQFDVLAERGWLAEDGRVRAPYIFVINGSNTTSRTVRAFDKPIFTLRAGRLDIHRAWLGPDMVVRLTPRALARLQSLPESFVLPEDCGLANKVIGNSVPPFVMAALARENLNG